MSDNSKADNKQPDEAVTEQTREDLKQAEKGKAKGAGDLTHSLSGDAAGIEAAEQEVSDGPPGRGIAR